MKNTTQTKPTPKRRARHQPNTHHTGAPPRRLYTDFLALAFYPGMNPPTPYPARVTAA